MKTFYHFTGYATSQTEIEYNKIIVQVVEIMDFLNVFLCFPVVPFDNETCLIQSRIS